jgi:hypothetical protein
MAPAFEEPQDVDIDAPLRAAPKLVAPEPGMKIEYLLMNCSNISILQSIAPDQNHNKQGKVMPVLAVRISRYAPLPRRVPTPTFLSSHLDFPQSHTRYSC